MNILAIDLGCTFGWALNDGLDFRYGSESLKMPTIDKRMRMDRRLDPRVVKFYDFIQGKILESHVGLVVFEDVQFIEFRKQGHLWSAYRTALWLAAAHAGVNVDCLNTTSLKKFATGGGGAKKDLMLAALKKADPNLDFSRMDDNVVDAVWLWKWAERHLNHV